MTTDFSVSQSRFTSLLDTAVDGMIVIDEAARVMIFNKACETLFGYHATEVLGQNIKMLMPPEYSTHHDEYLSAYIRSGVRKIIGIGREVRGAHKDGTIFPMELSVGEAMTPEGRQFIGIIRDLRPRKEIEERLNHLHADFVRMSRVSAVNEMGAALAHELNQPLTAVMLYLQGVMRSLSKRDAKDILDQEWVVLQKAVREAERAGQIIQRMRHFVEKGQAERKSIDLHAILDESIEMVMIGFRFDVMVVREFSQQPIFVHVDPIQIQQVMVNLLRNSIEAVRHLDEPRIVLRTRSGDDQCFVDVEDNGAGVPPDVVETLFKAFATSKGQGMGLGLAISRSIAQNHGGDVTVDAGGNGRGAIFTLRLPQNELQDE